MNINTLKSNLNAAKEAVLITGLFQLTMNQLHHNVLFHVKPINNQMDVYIDGISENMLGSAICSYI